MKKKKGLKSYSMSSCQDKDFLFRASLSGWIADCSQDIPELPACRDQDGVRRCPVVKVVTSVLCGLVFGVAIEKGRVFEPQIIRGQMVLQNFTMMKMFLSAAASGMLVFSLLTMIPGTTEKMNQAVDGMICPMRRKTIWASVLGGAILGAGMSLAGSCPGMVLAQVGAAVPNAVVVMAGGLSGAFLYALTEPVIPEWIVLKEPAQPGQSLDEYMGTPYFILALPLAAVLGLAVFTLELLFPWDTQVEQAGSGILQVKCWPPFVCGALIGSLQLPTILVIGDSLGSSTAYVTLAAQSLLLRPLRGCLTYLKPYRCGIHNWWQVHYIAAAVVGAFVSAKLSGTLHTVAGVGPILGFCGGVMLVYGSRLAGGCTSGHGLSGMGMLVLASFPTVCSMFGSAIAVGCLMKFGLGVEMTPV